MDQFPGIHHIALQCSEKVMAQYFYQNILGLKLKKIFKLDFRLAHQIFGISKEIEVLGFENEHMYIEVFIIADTKIRSCAHIGLSIIDIPSLISICKENNIDHFSVKKEEKTIWFIRDHSGNLFELKQK